MKRDEDPIRKIKPFKSQSNASSHTLSNKSAKPTVERNMLAGLSFGELLSVRKSVGQKTFNKIWSKSSGESAIGSIKHQRVSSKADSLEPSQSTTVKTKRQRKDSDESDDMNDSESDVEHDDETSGSNDHSDNDSNGSESSDDTSESKYSSDNETWKSKDDAGRQQDTQESMSEKPRFKKQKRENKNMPAEITSKRPVTRKRRVVEVSKKAVRDPRFEAYTGELNEGLFKRSYGFIDDYERSEIAMLKDEIKNEPNSERRAQLQKTMTSKVSRLSTNEIKEKTQKLKREWRKTESAKVQQGKTPFFLKNSELKRRQLVDKFKSLTEKGMDLDKVLEKRRKKNASREHRHIPSQRRSR
ncbi:rRNA biogenesis protein rrp36 [Batrachochytrium dendrobatidis]|nr:rRNA biogenesis protein rrp36 [Batrachochytrium dendrobatidis]KAK5667991.1 rRNA biogenesis protein rrp36 [Batrachochytrium dendrobatidis]